MILHKLLTFREKADPRQLTVCASSHFQGEVGEPGQKGSKGDKGEQVRNRNPVIVDSYTYTSIFQSYQEVRCSIV